MTRLISLFVFLFLLWASDLQAQNSSAGLTPCGVGKSFSASTSSSNIQLGTCGGTVVVTNGGAVGVYMKLGSTSGAVAALTDWQLPAGFSITLNVGTSGAYLAGITAASSATITIIQGTGSPALAGGGSGGGGGGGGAVTIADGADITQGAVADAAATAGGTGTLSSKFRLMTTQLATLGTNTTGIATAVNQATEIASLATIATNTGAAIPAGSAIIGKVGIDQTTPGTTNGVAIVGVNGATALAGNGATGTGSPRVTISSDNSAIAGVGAAATAGSVPANAVYQGLNVGGNLVGQVGDPCQVNAKNYQTISQTANTQLFAGTSSKKTYVCSIIVVGADAENISLVSGTGSVCGTSTAAMIGSTTAAAGPNLSANGGFSIGNGAAAMAVSAVNADNVCLFQSGSGRVAGVMTYVAQ